MEDAAPVRLPDARDMSEFDLWLAAQKADDPEAATFAAVAQALAEAPGHRLFTVLVHFEASGESQRAYSSRPAAYPVGGRKTLAQAPRMRRVLESGRPFIGRTRQDIVDNYADHALLLEMGCGSVVNMPVRWGRRVLGTVNLLDAEGRYFERDLPRVEAWAQLAAPALLAWMDRDA